MHSVYSCLCSPVLGNDRDISFKLNGIRGTCLKMSLLLVLVFFQKPNYKIITALPFKHCYVPTSEYSCMNLNVKRNKPKTFKLWVCADEPLLSVDYSDLKAPCLY